MPKLSNKPALALGVTVMLVFGAAGISAAATSTRLAGTTPEAQRAHGPRRAQDPTALAKALGVSVTQLEAAMEAARAKTTASDPETDAAAQIKTIAAALNTTEATVQAVLDAARPAGNEQRSGQPGHRGGAFAAQPTLITALATATGKSEATVKAALGDADEAQAAARLKREAEFANNLAVQLGLTESKVAAALEASRPAKPTRAAKQGTTQAK